MPEKRKGYTVEDGSFLVFVLIVTVAFAFVVLPFFGAILWALVLAILFGNLNRRLLQAMPRQKSLSAVLTLLIILIIVILPAIFLASALIDEATKAYQQVQSGQIDPRALFERFIAALPDSIAQRVRSVGWSDLSQLRESMSSSLASGARTIAGQALAVGQGTFNFLLMLSLCLYLTFFLLRDGDALARRVIEAVPMRADQREAIVRNFTIVIRATIKGSVVVAIVQGLIGGLTFWALGIEGALLWGVLMGVLSLIPAIGTGLVWVPVAIYLLATGAITKGIILALCGFFIISMVDNILRPILVGRDTRLPDYVVLFSTLGGLQVFGFHGFVVGPVVAALFIGTWNSLAEARKANGAAKEAAEAGPA